MIATVSQLEDAIATPVAVRLPAGLAAACARGAWDARDFRGSWNHKPEAAVDGVRMKIRPVITPELVATALNHTGLKPADVGKDAFKAFSQFLHNGALNARCQERKSGRAAKLMDISYSIKLQDVCMRGAKTEVTAEEAGLIHRVLQVAKLAEADEQLAIFSKHLNVALACAAKKCVSVDGKRVVDRRAADMRLTLDDALLREVKARRRDAKKQATAAAKEANKAAKREARGARRAARHGALSMADAVGLLTAGPVAVTSE